MLRVAARLFGPGLPAAGKPASLVVDLGQLQVEDGQALPVRIPAGSAELRRVGFDQRGVELAWRDSEGAWAVHVLDAADARALLAALPQQLAAAVGAFESTLRRQQRWRRLGLAALILVLAVPVLLLALLASRADELAGLVSSKIPVAHERQLGEMAYEQMKPNLKPVNDARRSAVVVLGERLTSGSRYRYEFHVVEDAFVNAFALPGGIVVVHTGLLAATTRTEQLAGVLAHEVEHVEQRHGLEAIMKSLGLRAMWALATGDLGGTLAGEAGQQLLELSFSRDAEMQADQAGFDRLVSRGIDPSGMAEFFDKLAKSGGPTPPQLLSTHPESVERSEAMRARIASLGGRRFEPLAPLP